MIDDIRSTTGHGVRRICDVLGVPRSSYYHAASLTATELSDREIGDRIEEIFTRHRRRYGYRRIWRELADAGIDLCTRRIVGWSLDRHMRAGLVGEALKQALQTRRPGAGLIFHSDRGSQYGSGEYRSLLGRAGAVQSMSARANPYHNAWMESFMGTLKGEMLQGRCFADARNARTEIFDFIEAYYNTHRKHSSLGYRTPAQFEANLNPVN